MTPPTCRALLLVDIQNDFCDGGALAVPDGSAIVPIVHALRERCDDFFDGGVYAMQD